MTQDGLTVSLRGHITKHAGSRQVARMMTTAERLDQIGEPSAGQCILGEGSPGELTVGRTHDSAGLRS